MTEPESKHTATSPQLNVLPRTLEAALFQSPRERGRLALKSWGKVAYVNVLESESGAFFDDYDLMTVAALAAAETPSRRHYIVTVCVTPERPHGAALGQHGGERPGHDEAHSTGRRMMEAAAKNKLPKECFDTLEEIGPPLSGPRGDLPRPARDQRK
jgi:hypothetical protein